MIRLRAGALVLGYLIGCLAQESGTFSQSTGSKIWIGRHQEIEEYLRTAECVSMEVFRPLVRCTLPPGGPAARMAWRALTTGAPRGFREIWQMDIAAYGLDKLLKLDMVPPTVYRELRGIDGAAQLWVENVVDGTAHDFFGDPRPEWQDQLTRMVMFDNLIGNKERNRGNMLRDPSWNLVLLDHSRAFGSDAELRYQMNRVDEGCWARMQGLTASQLKAALGRWLDESQIRAILERRERMRAEITALLERKRA